ncbi:MAG: C39 family peptidase [Lachnospiraceae bacterium]|nr:C39 family peptidase [Lachnospiraceae bacterium]
MKRFYVRMNLTFEGGEVVQRFMDVLSFVKDYLVIVTIVDIILIGLPIPAFARRAEKESYLIEGDNFSEEQGKCECAGFSSAYVYRHLGLDAKGMDTYQKMPCKGPKGYVYCKGIVKLARRNGFRAMLRTGNLNALKNTVAKGNPVIVMLRTRKGARGLHYVPVVGYDKEFIYITDSVKSNRNVVSPHFNRKIPVTEFKKLWNISMLKQPFFFNLFFEISGGQE